MVVFSRDSAETNVRRGGKINGHLMESCIRNICTKNYQNLIIGFQFTVKNVGDVFLSHSVVISTSVVENDNCWLVCVIGVRHCCWSTAAGP